jgi:hypothetical protein
VLFGSTRLDKITIAFTTGLLGMKDTHRPQDGPMLLRLALPQDAAASYGRRPTVEASYSSACPECRLAPPLAGESGTYGTVKAKLWRWISGSSPQHLSNCPLFARKRNWPMPPCTHASSVALQRYLAHQKPPPPLWTPLRTQGIGLR